MFFIQCGLEDDIIAVYLKLEFSKHMCAAKRRTLDVEPRNIDSPRDNGVLGV